MRFITRTILYLSLVSLLTDIASEMLYPIMPIYLRTIGFSVFLIGMLEGIAEATSGLSKGYFGSLSDHLQKRKPFIQWGYALSAFSKPMMALLTHPIWIFISRTSDRLGKGIRTAPRDALLSEEATMETKGRVFGFHRAFDTLGAAIGPTLALLFLSYHPEEYRTMFLLAFFPGILAVTTTFFIRENRDKLPFSADASAQRPGLFSFFTYWKVASKEFRLVVVGLLVFAFFNSSDLLLLLMLKHNGASDQQVIIVYIVYNLVYAFASFPAGILGDKLGLRNTFLCGLLVFAIVYGGINVVHSFSSMVLLFCLYGIYAAGTEGISKAWISNIVGRQEVATAIGFYTGMNSVATLLASSLAGWIWYSFGPIYAFSFASFGALLVVVYFIVAFIRRR